MKHIYKVIFDLSVDLVIFDLGLPSKVKSRSQTFQGVVSHEWCIIWSLYEIHIASHIWPFSLPYTFDLWWNWKGKLRSLGFQWAIFHKLSTFWPLFIRNTNKKSSMNYQFTSRHLTLDKLSRSNQGHMTSKGCIGLLNGASYKMFHKLIDSMYY